ncbi:histidinol dehydrogenase [Oceanicaulis sp. MMSF_3324]|uniref:histidinol dehydrogenase n=1 Tax=Oceanicaulis sp. MMSF_3324 TaxID=3046702 RepID=UPI00273EEE64|nr:histidinol dehydrogenase [Oceanicaulis sp. MMSF_3324]
MLTRIEWSQADAETRQRLFERPSLGSDALKVAQSILDDVRARGETAVREYAVRLDGWAPEAGFRVPQTELKAAADALSGDDRAAILDAANAVRTFHAEQGYRSYEVETWPGARAGRRVTPIDVAGLYVPAGTAPLVSTLIMLAVPAQLAQVPRIAVIAPPCKGQGVEPTVLAAASLLGVDEVYAIGGAHGVAALGLGAAGLPKADKIFGPGNAYVAAAKSLLAQSPDGAAADLPAGPSEVMVVADDKADAELVAIDLLSQAEHDVLAQVVLVAYSDAFARQVENEIERLLGDLPRAETARAALANSRVVLVSSDDEAAEAANAYASEHLIVQTDDPRALANKIRHAGSIFLGPWTPEAAGDYAAGPNHALPTAGAARAYGGVTVEMFQKTTTVLELSQTSLQTLGPVVERLATLEGLDAHRLAMVLRRQRKADR